MTFKEKVQGLLNDALAERQDLFLVNLSINDSFKRLIKPSIETEFANSSKELADDEAIKVFA